MRVCFITRSFPPRGTPGMMTYAYELTKELSKLKVDVHLVCDEAPKFPRQHVTADGVHVHRVKIPKALTVGFSVISCSPLILSEIGRIDKEYGFDLVFGNGSDGVHYAIARALGRFNGRPLLSVIHGIAVDEIKILMENAMSYNIRGFIDQHLHWPQVHILDKITYMNSDKIIAVSTLISKRAQIVHSIPACKIEVIPNGVDIHRFSPRRDSHELRNRLNIQNDPIVLFVGPLTPKKGLKFLLEAAQKILVQIPETRFLLVGSGFWREEYTRELKRMVYKQGMSRSVLFLGYVSNQMLIDLYSSADVFVLPSIVEAYGMVVLEAMSCQLPVVVTRTTGVASEAIKDGETGIIVDPGNSEQLAESILRLLTDSKYAKRIGKNAREFVSKNFTWEKVAIQVRNLFERTLSAFQCGKHK